jgi:hypothetical protein
MAERKDWLIFLGFAPLLVTHDAINPLWNLTAAIAIWAAWWLIPSKTV